MVHNHDISLVIDNFLSKIQSLAELKIVLVIATESQSFGEWKRISYSTILERTGLMRDEVGFSVRRLIEQRFIRVKKIPKTGDDPEIWVTLCNVCKQEKQRVLARLENDFSLAQKQQFSEELDKAGSFEQLMMDKEAARRVNGELTILGYHGGELEGYVARHWIAHYNDPEGKALSGKVPYVYWRNLRDEM